MKIIHTSRIEFSEAGPGLCTGFFAMAQRMQSAALAHCEKAEGGAGALVAADSAWVLNAFGAKISAYPGPGDSLEVTTWSRGFKGVRTFRDFSIVCNGRPVAQCSSVWLRISLKNKRILKITPEMMAPYTQETETVVGHLAENFKPGEKQARDVLVPLALRASDLDPLGHVNHSVFFDFLDTLAHAVWPKSRGMGFFRIRFFREMPPTAICPAAGLDLTDSPGFFSIHDKNSLFASGEMAPMPDEQGPQGP